MIHRLGDRSKPRGNPDKIGANLITFNQLFQRSYILPLGFDRSLRRANYGVFNTCITNGELSVSDSQIVFAL